MLTLPLPDDFPTQPALLAVSGVAGRWLLTVLHQASTAAETAYAACYLVDAAWASATLIGRSDLFGKDVGACAGIQGSTVFLIVTEATPGGPGASSEVHVYTFEDAVPAAIDRTRAIAQALWDCCGALTGALTRLAGKMKAIAEG